VVTGTCADAVKPWAETSAHSGHASELQPAQRKKETFQEERALSAARDRLTLGMAEDVCEDARKTGHRRPDFLAGWRLTRLRFFPLPRSSFDSPPNGSR